MVRPSLSSKNIPRSSSTPNTRIAPNRSGVRSRNSSPAPINNISPIMADLNLSSIRNKPAKLPPIWDCFTLKEASLQGEASANETTFYTCNICKNVRLNFVVFRR